MDSSPDSSINSKDSLLRTLRDEGVFETDDGLRARELVLSQLSDLIMKWIDQLRPKNVSDCGVCSHGARLMPFGGYSLGIVSPSSDLDVVCVVPNFVKRSDFFSSFEMLLSQETGITKMRMVEEAYVPIISIVFDGYEVDMCLAIMNMENIPADIDITDNDVLRGMDVHSVRSLNGVRETAIVKRLTLSIENLQTLVRAVKLWAKRKGMYGAGLGFIAGIGWTVMAARICQLHPEAPADVLLHKFFSAYAIWDWPRPVLLKELESDTDEIKDCVQWNPQVHKSDSYHLMPVITPAYPEHNAAVTVTRSARELYSRHMKTDVVKMAYILQGKVQWNELFAPHDITTLYKHFLMVTVGARSEQDLDEWNGLVASRLRLLVTCLEKQKNIELLHPWPTSHKLREKNVHQWFIGLEFARTENLTLDLAKDIADFTSTVKSLAHERRILKQGMTIDVRHVKRKEVREHLEKTTTH